MHLAQTLDLHFHLVGGIRLQDFQYHVGFIAVGLQSLPHALPNQSGQWSKDTVISEQHGVGEKLDPVNEEPLRAHHRSLWKSRGSDVTAEIGPPVVDVIYTGSRGHFLGPHPGQSYFPRKVSCPLKILDFVYS